MEQRQIESRVWTYVIFAIVASLLSRILLVSFGFDSVGAWIMVFLIMLVVLVVAFIFIRFLRKESKKGKEAKKRVESVAVTTWTTLLAIIFYIGGALFFLFGVLFLGILVLALIKGDISDLGSLAVGGSGLFLIVLGVAVIFLGRYFSKRKIRVSSKC